MIYEVKYSNQSSKILKKLNKDLVKRILNKINELKNNPYPQESSKVKGTNYHRIRVENHRIIHDIDNENNTLGIVKIDKRERVYD